MKKTLTTAMFLLSAISVYGQQGNVGNRNRSANPSPSSSITVTANGVSFKMIKVQGGTFTMGATAEQGSDHHDAEKPAHSVTLSDYYIGET
jgi:formylglycine-generating enzyme required for sulfatase activity